MNEDALRGSGRTRAQIITAPKNAVFVWPNEELWYPKALAQDELRTDLRIVGRAWLNTERNFCMEGAIDVVVDHSTWGRLTDAQRRTLWVIEQLVKSRRGF